MAGTEAKSENFNVHPQVRKLPTSLATTFGGTETGRYSLVESVSLTRKIQTTPGYAPFTSNARGRKGCFRQRLRHGQRHQGVRELRSFSCSWKRLSWLETGVHTGAARMHDFIEDIECQAEEHEMFLKGNGEPWRVCEPGR